MLEAAPGDVTVGVRAVRYRRIALLIGVRVRRRVIALVRARFFLVGGVAGEGDRAEGTFVRLNEDALLKRGVEQFGRIGIDDVPVAELGDDVTVARMVNVLQERRPLCS